MKIEITDEMTLAAAERYANFTYGKGAFASHDIYAQAQSKFAAQVILKAALPRIRDAVLEEAIAAIRALKTGAAP